MDKLENNSHKTNDIELIRQAMQQQCLGAAPIAKPGHRDNQKRLELQKNVMEKKKAFEVGYDFCIKEIEGRSIDGSFVSGDDIPAISVEALKINDNASKKISGMDFWESYVEHPTKIQFLMNYSNDMLLSIYELAGIFYHNKQHQEAIKIYKFLCLLNPFIPSFWIGLGLSLEDDMQLPEAIEAYETASQLAPSNFTPYLGLIRCSELLNDFTKIVEQLKKALNSADLKEDAQVALEYLSTKAKVGD